jgi:hypothetical protein
MVRFVWNTKLERKLLQQHSDLANNTLDAAEELFGSSDSDSAGYICKEMYFNYVNALSIMLLNLFHDDTIFLWEVNFLSWP